VSTVEPPNVLDHLSKDEMSTCSDAAKMLMVKYSIKVDDASPALLFDFDSGDVFGVNCELTTDALIDIIERSWLRSHFGDKDKYAVNIDTLRRRNRGHVNAVIIKGPNMFVMCMRYV